MDPVELRELVPRVLGVLVGRGADFATAEDAVQEALIRAPILAAATNSSPTVPETVSSGKNPHAGVDREMARVCTGPALAVTLKAHIVSQRGLRHPAVTGCSRHVRIPNKRQYSNLPMSGAAPW